MWIPHSKLHSNNRSFIGLVGIESIAGSEIENRTWTKSWLAICKLTNLQTSKLWNSRSIWGNGGLRLWFSKINHLKSMPKKTPSKTLSSLNWSTHSFEKFSAKVWILKKDLSCLPFVWDSNFKRLQYVLERHSFFWVTMNDRKKFFWKEAGLNTTLCLWSI